MTMRMLLHISAILVHLGPKVFWIDGGDPMQILLEEIEHASVPWRWRFPAAGKNMRELGCVDLDQVLSELDRLSTVCGVLFVVYLVIVHTLGCFGVKSPFDWVLNLERFTPLSMLFRKRFA